LNQEIFEIEHNDIRLAPVRRNHSAFSEAQPSWQEKIQALKGRGSDMQPRIDQRFAIEQVALVIRARLQSKAWTGKESRKLAFVSGHDFSRADRSTKRFGLQPLREAASQSGATEKAPGFNPAEADAQKIRPSGSDLLSPPP
jgi:hypothetical protein